MSDNNRKGKPMIKTIREVAIRLLQGCGNVDDRCCVKIVKRDKDGSVIKQALLPISYLDAGDNICVEHSQIKWADYTSFYGPAVPEDKGTHVSYEEFSRQLETVPNTWIPSLLRKIVEQCLQREIFVKGGMETYIRDAKAQWNKPKQDGENVLTKPE